MDRRAQDRCPVCQGPAVEDKSLPEGLRCRTSTCAHNFSDQSCPRCQGQTIDQVSYAQGSYRLHCSDCQNSWQVPDPRASDKAR